jgi:hexulose-6-phosphate isomerase
LVERVVAGDNTPYKAYMDAHNRATVTSRKAVEELIPYAAEHKVVIALENVWNNLWVKPEIFAAFVRSFRSLWVKAYLDLGNHVKYAPTLQWVQALGHDIAKCHVKDFRLNPDGHGGKWADIRDGSVHWPKVRAALDRLDYNGWLTIEGSGGLSIQQKGERLDLILAGK